MMIVVPSFAKGQKGNKPVIGGIISNGKAPLAPHVSCGIHQPGSMQAHHRPQEDAPQQEGQSAEGEKQHAQCDYRQVVVLGDPHVKLIFRQVGDVVGLRGGVVMHGSSCQNPTHV